MKEAGFISHRAPREKSQDVDKKKERKKGQNVENKVGIQCLATSPSTRSASCYHLWVNVLEASFRTASKTTG